MARRIFIAVRTVLEVVVEDESVTAEEIIQEMDYNFTSTVEGTNITDTRIDEFEELD